MFKLLNKINYEISFYNITLLITFIISIIFFIFSKNKDINNIFSGPVMVFVVICLHLYKEHKENKEKEKYRFQLTLELKSILDKINKYQENPNHVDPSGKYLTCPLQIPSFLNTNCSENRKFLTEEQIRNLYNIFELLDKNNRNIEFQRACSKRDGSATLNDRLDFTTHNNNIIQLKQLIGTTIENLSKQK